MLKLIPALGDGVCHLQNPVGTRWLGRKGSIGRTTFAEFPFDDVHRVVGGRCRGLIACELGRP
ncbi:MAG: hypothetical protein JWP25_4524 [Bradyrhizobium sp.]|jgi:hypothetical protein|nr:hypothetical protein [Bradyrhizobium sp.]MEA2866726.1 hypothetical protein [Bradyrhizobium sp.]